MSVDATAKFAEGIAHHRSKRTAQAEQCYREVLAAQPDHEFALQNLALLLRLRGEYRTSARLLRMACALRPDDADVRVSLARSLNLLGEHDAALDVLDQALLIAPQHRDSFNNKGVTYQHLGRFEDALANFNRAVEIDPQFGLGISNSALMLETLGRYEEAVQVFRRGLELDPDNHVGRGARLGLQLRLSDWSDYEVETRRVAQLAMDGIHADQPISFLLHSDDPEAQLQCARAYAAAKQPARPAPMWGGERVASDKIRLGYVSSDFRDHAVGQLVRNLFGRHDRARFHLTGFALSPKTEDGLRTELQGQFDAFHDVSDLDDVAIARSLRRAQVDIAIDLNGFTTHCRPGVFAHRPAPIQVNYLGYPGTLGLDYMDYIIGDRHVIPAGAERFYSEQVIRLPGSYQINSIRTAQVADTPTRAECGLPDDRFIFAAFNDSKKITPAMFDTWAEILKGAPGSVLWLLAKSPVIERNLRSEAAKRGVEAERLVFAPRVPGPRHLARHRLADLFLDTFPYTAHTTASDALGVGLPLVTLMGRSFQARVAGGILKELGLDELVTETVADYRDLAIALARAPERLAGIRARLAGVIPTARVLDAGAVCRDLERAFEIAWDRHRSGLPPQGFDVRMDD